MTNPSERQPDHLDWPGYPEQSTDPRLPQPVPAQPGPVGALGDAAMLAECRHTADKTLSTPVSYIGAAKMIWPLSQGSADWTSALKHAGVAVLVFLFWVLVTTPLYAVIFSTIVLAIIWAVYTLNRRHHIHQARNILASRP
jgi:hypothetical protein